MAESTVKITGITELGLKTMSLTSATETVLRNRVWKHGQQINYRAKRFAPPPRLVPRETEPKGIRQSLLKKSIMVGLSQDRLRAENRIVGRAKTYAPFVEFGTGRRGAMFTLDYLPPGYRHGSKPGMLPQPFLIPAWMRERPLFEAGCRADIAALIRRKSR